MPDCARFVALAEACDFFSVQPVEGLHFRKCAGGQFGVVPMTPLSGVQMVVQDGPELHLSEVEGETHSEIQVRFFIE